MGPVDSHADKATAIIQACEERDHATLAVLATGPDGFLTDELRQTAWPILLGCRSDDESKAVPWTTLPAHRDEEQVQLDVNRSFVYYPSNQSPKELEVRKEELSDLIKEVLRRHPSLCYFQGYHDIAQVLLLVLGAKNAPPAVARLSLLRIRDFMLPSLSAAVAHLRLISPLIRSVDPALWMHLEGTQPFFALAATLTLYAHDIQEYGVIARLFDFLLAKEAVISVYLFAVIILARKKELLGIPVDEPEMLHFTLSKLPQPLDIESLISETIVLFGKHPPESLGGEAWRRISSYSVLKTTRDLPKLTNQTLEEGERYLDKQAAQLRMYQLMRRITTPVRKFLWKSRLPIQFTTIAVAIAILSWCLGRSNSATSNYFLGLMRTPLERVPGLFGRRLN